MANAHIKFLKSMVEEDLPKVDLLCGRQISPRPQSKRLTSLSKISGGGSGFEGAVSRVLRESIINPATGKTINVAKVFVVTPENLPYQDVGWIHRSCANNCMICNAAFGMMSRKHNCYSCGYVVCNTCSNREAQIDQLQSPRLRPEENSSKFRVCKRCMKGAKKVSAIITPRHSTSSSTGNERGKFFYPEEAQIHDDDNRGLNEAKDNLDRVNSNTVASEKMSNPPVKKEMPQLLIPSDSEVHLVETEHLILPNGFQSTDMVQITTASPQIELAHIPPSQSSPQTSISTAQNQTIVPSKSPSISPSNNVTANIDIPLSSNAGIMLPPTPSRSYLHRAPIPKQSLESPRIRRDIYKNHGKHLETVNLSPSPKEHDVKGIAESSNIPEECNSSECSVTENFPPVKSSTILTGIMVSSHDEFVILPFPSEDVPAFSLAQNVLCTVDPCIIS